MLYDECPDSSGAFKNENLGHITCIFEDTSDSRLRLWGIQNYKEVTEFIIKISVCDIGVISPDDLSIY